MPKFTLIGLCQPATAEGQAGFDEWFVDQHIEDTAHCPHMIRGSVFKLVGDHVEIDTPADYLSVYEVEAESYEEAERILNEWQADPNAWEGRAHHHATREKYGDMPMTINGSGWYELIKSYDGPKSTT